MITINTFQKFALFLRGELHRAAQENLELSGTIHNLAREIVAVEEFIFTLQVIPKFFSVKDFIKNFIDYLKARLDKTHEKNTRYHIIDQIELLEKLLEVM